MKNTLLTLLAFALALMLLLPPGIASADIISQIRDDYDAHTPFANETSIGKIADTHGTGTWSFYGSTSRTSGGTLTSLTYLLEGVGGVDGYGLSGQEGGMPGISHNGFWGDINGFTDPPSDALAVHPGHQDEPIQFLLVRWTAGIGSVGTFNIAGGLTTRNVSASNGVTLDVLHNGANQFTTTVPHSSTRTYDLVRTIAAGDTVDFIIGHNGVWNSDRSNFSATVTGTPIPEPSSIVLLLAGAMGLLLVRRRRYAQE